MVGLVGYVLIVLGVLIELGRLRVANMPPAGPWAMMGAGALVAAWDAHRRDSRMFPVIVVVSIVALVALWAARYAWRFV